VVKFVHGSLVYDTGDEYVEAAVTKGMENTNLYETFNEFGKFSADYAGSSNFNNLGPSSEETGFEFTIYNPPQLGYDQELLAAGLSFAQCAIFVKLSTKRLSIVTPGRPLAINYYQNITYF
jgi:hypothetical protein